MKFTLAEDRDAALERLKQMNSLLQHAEWDTQDLSTDLQAALSLLRDLMRDLEQ